MKRFAAHIRKSDKQIQPLEKHLEGVSRRASKFASKAGMPRAGGVLGQLHDVGKATGKFQHYIFSAEGLIPKGSPDWLDAKKLKGKIDHATAGAQIAYDYLWNKGAKERFAAQVLALCIASHHSGLIDCLTPDGMNNFLRRMSKSDDEIRKEEALHNSSELGQFLEEHLTAALADEIAAKFQGLREESDKGDTFAFKMGLLLRFLLSCLIDADRLDTADNESPENEVRRNLGNYVPWETLIGRLEAKLATFDANPEPNLVDILRSQISQACLDFSTKPKGIYQLTVPTGGGKTLASLRFALNHAQSAGDIERIIYVIPYTSIIDQNARNIRKILEERGEDGRFLNRVVLEHHSNLTPESERGEKKSPDQADGPMEEENVRQSLLSENWDAPVVLTTQVQFLEALFGSGTRSVRRMHQLANSVIILDEVQSFPIKTIHMLNVALRFLAHDCGATVVLCTATQPPLEKIEAEHRALTLSADSHIMPNEKELFERLKRVEVHDCRRKEGWSVEEVADLAGQQMEACGSTLVVVNTRSQALELYRAIAEMKLEGVALYHLSTNMCAAHRLAVIEKMKSQLGPDKPERIICISTQLIEAGVDIDFGAVIRYLAGLDSIAQSAGRCNRSGKRKRLGQVFIVNARGEILGSALKDIQVGANHATTLLHAMSKNPEIYDGDPIGIDAMASYYTDVYKKRAGEMKYPLVGKDDFLHGESVFNLLAANLLALTEYRERERANPPLDFAQSFLSAAREFEVIDTDTIGVIVQFQEGKYIVNELSATDDFKLQRKLLKRAQRYSVNLFRPQFQELVNNEVVHETQAGSGIFYLDKEYYSDYFGWSDNPAGEMALLLIGN